MDDRDELLRHESEATRDLLIKRNAMLEDVKKWIDEHGASDHEKRWLSKFGDIFSEDLNDLLSALQGVPDIETRLTIMHHLGIVITSSNALGLGRRNPLIERTIAEEKKKRPSKAQHRRNVEIPALRLEILGEHAKKLWRKNPKRNGNAQGTAGDIVDAVMEDLARAGIDESSREKLVEKIRKELPTVDGWKPRSTRSSKLATQNSSAT
jgi:hypothetical protein